MIDFSDNTNMDISINPKLDFEIASFGNGLDMAACMNIGPQGPQGEKGDTGPRGEKGEKGDKGDTGAGFKVLDYYATLDALKEDIQAPNVGDAYGIGTAEPYDIYI